MEAQGVPPDVTRTGVVDLLAAVDPRLVDRFLDRIDGLRRPQADEIIADMRTSVGRQEGSFVNNPITYVDRTLRATAASIIDPLWRELGGLPPAEVEGLPARVDHALELILRDGLGYLPKTENGEIRASMIPRLRDGFLDVFARIEPDLRGELIARLERWPQREINWLVMRAVTLGIEPDLTTARLPSEEEIASFEAEARRELLRDAVLLRFEDASAFESMGSYYRQRDCDDPALVAASIELLKRPPANSGEYIRNYLRYAVEVLSHSTLNSPEIDETLHRVAQRGGEDGWRAVIGLIARNAADPPFQVLLKAAGERFHAGHVLLSLRELLMANALDRIPTATLASVVQALGTHRQEFDRLAAGWIRYGQLSIIDLVRRLRLIGPLTQAAIDAHAEA